MMRLTSRSTYLGCALFLLAGTAWAQNGAQLYNAHCAACHSSGVARVPPESALRSMSAAQVLATLQSGVMKTIGQGLTAAAQQAVASYLGTATPQAAANSPSAFCGARAQPLADHGSSWTGWSTDGANTRFQNAAEAGITAAQVPRLKLKWAFSLGAETEARSQPAVYGGRIFFGNGQGEVYALDAQSGCVEWMTKVDNGLRSGVAVGKTKGAGPVAVFFGAGPNAYALNATTGAALWKTRVAQHVAAMITAAPLLRDGSLYVSVSSFEELLAAAPGYKCCSFRGSVVALQAATGKQQWKTYTMATPAHPTVKDNKGVQMYGPSGGAVWSTATLDPARRLIYVATGDNYSVPATKTSDSIFALNPKTGAIAWSQQLTSGDVFNDGCAQPGNVTCSHPSGHDSDFGQPPILVSLPHGRQELIIGQKSGAIYAVDPSHQGKLIWTTQVGKGGPLGGTEWGSASDGRNMYVAVSDRRLKSYAPLLPDTTQGGGLWALSLSSGKTVWQAPPVADCGQRTKCSPAQSQAVSAIPGVIFSGSDDGHLRAYSAATGTILWDVDTARAYKTVNGPAAHGGSLDGPGPVIAGGMLYVNSGWGEWGGTPGNVLLAYSVDGQ